MFKHILGPPDHHRARDPETYRRRHEEFLRKEREHGIDVHHHLAEEPKLARIDLGTWLVDCECQNGCATRPGWGFALCYQCGAEHEVVFPDDWRAIEAEILKRPNQRTRFWYPGQSVDELRAQNRAHGVGR